MNTVVWQAQSILLGLSSAPPYPAFHTSTILLLQCRSHLLDIKEHEVPNSKVRDCFFLRFTSEPSKAWAGVFIEEEFQQSWTVHQLRIIGAWLHVEDI